MAESPQRDMASFVHSRSEQHHGSAIRAERAMWDATLERGMVDLKHKQILARVDVLNSMNTQACDNCCHDPAK